MTSRIMRGALAGALLALILVACSRSSDTGSNTAATRSRFNAVLLRGNGPDPDSLDPQRARSAESQSILRDLCEGLTTLDKNAGVAPGVASEWTMSPDGKTYTFKLRPDARWSNGDRVI